MTCMQDIKERRDEDLLVLPTDAAIFEDPSFKVKFQNVTSKASFDILWLLIYIEVCMCRNMLRNML